MSFWSRTTAAPTVLHMAWGDARPRVLRTTPAEFPTLPPGVTAKRATMDDTAALCTFWRTYYGGADWWFAILREDVAAYLTDSAVYIGLLLTDTGAIVGAIASVPFTGGHTHMSHGASLAPAAFRVIEGLCVHSAHRGQQLAGCLIALADAETSRTGPVVHLWGRELPVAPWMLSTALCAHVYAYLDCVHAQKRLHVSPCALQDVRIRPHTAEGPHIISYTPNNRCGRLQAWTIAGGIAGDAAAAATVVVVDTRRKPRGGDPSRSIFEVVWCSPHTTAAALETVGAMLGSKAILFASSASYQGGATAAWTAPWHYGTAGVHAWYIYNYIPPAFGDCDIYGLREEL